jgi:hypothetical protein
MSEDTAFRLFIWSGAAGLVFVILGVCLLFGVTTALA